jgi:hypothetical protein
MRDQFKEAFVNMTNIGKRHSDWHCLIEEEQNKCLKFLLQRSKVAYERKNYLSTCCLLGLFVEIMTWGDGVLSQE